MTFHWNYWNLKFEVKGAEHHSVGESESQTIQYPIHRFIWFVNLIPAGLLAILKAESDACVLSFTTTKDGTTLPRRFTKATIRTLCLEFATLPGMLSFFGGRKLWLVYG